MNCFRILRDEDGSVLIETALSLMLIMTVVLGIIECCMMVYSYSVYADAARQGVRYAIVHGTASSSCSGPSSGCADSAGANVAALVKSYASSYTAPVAGLTVLATYPDHSSAAPSRVMVTVTYTYIPLFHMPGTSAVFTATSAGRILY